MTLAYTPRRIAWDLIYAAVNFGLVGKIDPTSLKFTKQPIKRGTTGDLVLGHWITNLEGSIKVQITDDLARSAVAALAPWSVASGSSVPGSGPINLFPPLNANLYDYAALLTLHPHDLDIGVTTQDLNFVKAMPMSCINFARDGKTDDMWEVEFQPYPDISKLTAGTPSLVYGYYGTVPS